MISEDKIKAMRADADNRLRELTVKAQEISHEIQALQEHLQRKQIELGQVGSQIIDARASLSSLMIVLGEESGGEGANGQ